MFDPIASFSNSPTAPASQCFAIVPADAAELAVATRALYVGVGGDVVLQPVSGGGDVTFRNLPSGAILDVRLRAVRATGTTASALVGLA